MTSRLKILIPKIGVLALLSLFCEQGVSAQTPVQDTLAVRLCLDVNGLITIPVSQVANTNNDGRIVSLNLSSKGLTKIPPEVGVLSKLTSLNLSDNLLESLPTEIWDLTQITTLDLSKNRLVSLDDRIRQLKDLLFLNLESNALSVLPNGLFSLEILDVLILSNNALDTLPENTADLLFLTYLNASDNQLRTLPNTMAAMSKLDSMNLSGNLITRLPEIMTSLTTVKKVYLGDNQLCNLSPSLEAWVTAKDPVWKNTQICGVVVRPIGNRTNSRGIRLLPGSEWGGQLVDLSDIVSAYDMQTLEVSLLDIQGKRYFRRVLKSALLNIPKPELDRMGSRVWLEVRNHSRVLATRQIPLHP